MEKFIYYNELYLIYKDLINEKNREIFDLYYGDNMTMQEIADLKNISKSRVGIIIKKTTELLDKYEDKLKIRKNNELINKALDSNNIKEIKEILKEIIE